MTDRPNNKSSDTSSTQSGFTLTELLISVAVGAMVSLLMVSTFVYTYAAVLIEQRRTEMVMQSQLFLRRMVEDIRVANSVLTNNSINDSNPVPGGTWTTSDPANILIVTQPVTDSSDDLVYDSSTGYPYQNEIVYFGYEGVMYRRLLANTTAPGNSAISTCWVELTSCSPDSELLDNLDNMLFTFYDEGHTVTSTPENARSVEITINLKDKIYGREVTATNTAQVTLRNEK